jgi:cyanophycin synthetase
VTRGSRPPSDSELAELRVLEGPNRFFTRPAVKLEFCSSSPGQAMRVAEAAGEAIRRLHLELALPAPRLTFRRSVDDLRAVVAYPWRRRTISQSIGAAAARVVLGQRRLRSELSGLRAVALGPLVSLPEPRIPLVAITGTNGKSTVTRLVAHVAAAAGMRVGMTNSDGIFVKGRLVEAGDWTGFGGAGRILAERDLDLAVLETARGGILLRGIGYRSNDVAVVTNVSADHLGLQGIDTLEELAEVKGAIVRITRRDGWAVLNAEDPLVWAMRRESRAQPYAFALDPDAPGVTQALADGGRAAVLRDGWLVLRRAGRRSVRVVAADELPVTVAGLSRHNVANALAAAAACDALGIKPRAVASGLRSFAQDAAANPGRLNLYERDGVLVLIDFAHNEAGLAGLLEVARPLTTGVLRLALGTAGDRSDEILHGLGIVAGERADEIVICEKPHYLRGRERQEMIDLLRGGVAAVGRDPDGVDALPSELAALQVLVERSAAGDVAAVMTHAERAEIFDWLAGAGFCPVSLKRLRQLVGR